MTDDEIRKLFYAAATGSERAFTEIVNLYEKPVYLTAYGMMKSKEDAEDASQETFLKLWRSIDTYRGECNPTTWVIRITRNTVIDMMRKHSRRKIVSLTPEDDERETDIPDTDIDSDPVKSYEKQEASQQLRQALKKLPDNYREIIILRDVNGLCYEDIAVSLGITVGNVKSRLWRAREKLRNILSGRNYQG